jgi:pimeloyl-ACP methyl ester carboxylesterase
VKQILFVTLIIVVFGAAAVGYAYWKAVRGVSVSSSQSKYLTATDRFIDIAGARLRVREEGPTDGPVIILLHGFTFSLETWDGWAQELSKTYRVIRYDLLGHGLTGPDPQKRYAPQERAAFLQDVMDALAVNKAHIVGNSLGGLIAWRFAVNNPERVDRLILMDAGAYPMNGVTDIPAPVPPAIETFLRTAPEQGVRASMKFLYADSASITDERIALARDMMRREGNGDAFVEHLREFTLPDPNPDLARISAPVLVMWGRQDKLIPVDHGLRMEAAIADARLIIYDDAGHVPQEEISETTVRDAISFLNEAAGTHE